MGTSKFKRKQPTPPTMTEKEARQAITDIGLGLSNIPRRKIYDFCVGNGHISLGFKSVTRCFKEYFTDKHYTTLDNHYIVAQVEYEYGGYEYIGKNSVHSMLLLTRLEPKQFKTVLNVLEKLEDKITRTSVKSKIEELFPKVLEERCKSTPEDISSRKRDDIAKKFVQLTHDDKKRVIELFLEDIKEEKQDILLQLDNEIRIQKSENDRLKEIFSELQVSIMGEYRDS